MIPKIIHYCWFGRNPKTKLMERCLASWKKHCPDFEIIEWNEDNFNVNNAPVYVQQAYEAKKWAFVTDYVRLWVLTEFGGVYMDTDVEVVKSLDPFLSHEAFSGFESEKDIPTGIMASEKGFMLFKEFLSFYDTASFLNDDGTPNMITNVTTITQICLKHGLVRNGQYQIIDGFALYPSDYFCPYDNNKGVLNDSINTVTIHWFNKSWVSNKDRIRSKVTRPIHRLFGNDALAFLRKRK